MKARVLNISNLFTSSIIIDCARSQEVLGKNSDVDLNCDGYCPMLYEEFLIVMEYKNDRWTNLGTLFKISLHNSHKRLRRSFMFAGRQFKNRIEGHLRPVRIGYASGLSWQNQLMILGGERERSAFGYF